MTRAGHDVIAGAEIWSQVREVRCAAQQLGVPLAQWWDEKTALLQRPDISGYLDNQFDLQEMVEVTPVEHHRYRTVRLAVALKHDKEFESQVWADEA